MGKERISLLYLTKGKGSSSIRWNIQIIEEGFLFIDTGKTSSPKQFSNFQPTKNAEIKNISNELWPRSMQRLFGHKKH